MINPYANVNFTTAHRVQSVSHAHGREATYWQTLYDYGIRHFAMSNYHPSEPYYPLTDYWTDAPNDILSAPNAEYYQFTQQGSSSAFPLHANGIGCTYERDGMEEPYNTGFKTILNTLIQSDGGGITINHPKYSGTPLTAQKVCNMLDVDDRVLGLEVYNANEYSPMSDGKDSTDIWDDVLKTGRRCWGFGVPDWAAYGGGSNWKGRNILLVSELTDSECLKAYREGRFYVAYFGSGLTFDSFDVTDKDISISATGATSIKIVTDFGTYQTSGASASISFQQTPIFVRVEATDGTERIMSQPVMIKKADDMSRPFLTVLQ